MPAGVNPESLPRLEIDLGFNQAGIREETRGIGRNLLRDLAAPLRDFKFDVPAAMRDFPAIGRRIRESLADVGGAARTTEAQMAALGKTVEQARTKWKFYGESAEGAFKEATGGSRRLNEEMDDLADATRRAGQRFRDMDLSKADQDFFKLEARLKALQKEFKRVGADPGLAEGVGVQLRRVLSLQTQFNEQYEEMIRDPKVRAAWRSQAKLASDAANDELQIAKRTLKSIGDQRRDESVEQRGDRQRANNLLVAQEKRAQSKLVAITQQETALKKAEIRTQSNQSIQASQRTARVRIELLKFTFRQIRQIERSIGAVFKGTAAVVAGAFARVERTIFRIGGVFKRGNKDFTQGLSPALNRREGIIRRSFGRQEANVRGSVARQSVTLRRFETQASTGIAGALTGRSSLGALFGGGLAIGGGFSLFRKLSQSIQVGGDFIQGLAVLQAQLQLTEQEMVGVRQLSIDLGNDITLPGVSALDAAQAIAALAKQFGALGDAALPAAEAAAKGVLSLSRATGATAEEAAAIVGAATNVFGISADQAVATADKVTAALTVSAGVGISDFKDAFTQGAAVFSAFQKPVLGAEGALVEFNTALAVLARGGLTGSQAGTGLKQFFIQSVKAGDSFVALRKQISDAAGVSGSVFFDADGGARALTDSIDILRKGLTGLTDEAKQTTLIKLFGARASTVALNLINADPADFDLIRVAQERQGAAAKVAEAQNVGLRGALDALGSVIETQQIKTYEKWQGAAAKVVLVLADLFQKFFDGEGAMKTFRDALVGITVALGGLLALKGAFELTKFLGIGLSGLISPLGIAVVGIGALGAAFAVLLKSSYSFSTAISNIGSSLSSAVVPILKLAGDLFASFVNLLDEKVAPSIVRFSVALAEGIENQVGRFVWFLRTGAIPALVKFKDAFVEIAGPIVRDVFEFIKSIVNPVLERLGQLIQITVVPAFDKMAEVLRDKVDPALQKVRDIGGAIRDEIGPLIQPATDAFKALGEAIGAIAGKRVGPGGSITDRDLGDLSALVPAFQGVVSGIAQSFANIADRIIEVVGPQIPRLLGWIIGQFNEDKLLAIVQAFGRIAEGIGTALGAIASSPEFLGALTAIAATAGFLAVKFLQGFLDGVLEGLGRTFAVLEDEFGDGVRDLLSSVFDPKIIAGAVLAGFAAVAIGSALFGALKTPATAAGRKTGKAFATGLAGGVRAGPRGNFNFLRGLVGGTRSLESQARSLGIKSAQATQRAFDKSLRDLQRLGGASSVGVVGRVSEKDLKQINKALDETKGRLNEFGVQGALTRARITDSFSGIRQSAKGLNTAFTGLRLFDKGLFDRGVSDLRTGFGRVGNAVRDGFIDARDTFRASGVTVGQAIGTSMIGGIVSALSGQAAGTALASGSKSGALGGLGGIIAGALIASTVPGIGPALALSVLAVGGLTTALSFQSEKAKKAKEEIKEYSDALAGAATQSDILAAAVRTLNENLADENDDTILFLDAGKFSAEGFADAVLDGADVATEAFKVIKNVFGPELEDELTGVLSALEGLGFEPLEALQALSNLEGLKGGLGVEGLTDDVVALAEALEAAGFSGEDISEVIDFLGDEKIELEIGLKVGGARQDIASRIAEDLNAIEDIRFQNIKDRLAATGKVIDDRVVPSFGDIKLAIADLNRIRTEPLQAELNDLVTEAEVLTSTIGESKAALQDLIDGDYKNTFQEAIDDAIISIPQIASSFQQALDEPNAKLGESQRRNILGDWAPTVSAVINKGIEDAQLAGIAPGDIDLEGIVGPLRQFLADFRIPVEIDGETVFKPLSPEVIDAFNGQIDSQVDGGIGATLEFIGGLEKQYADLQEQMDKLKVEISADVIFTAAQINAALAARFGEGTFKLFEDDRLFNVPDVPQPDPQDFLVPAQAIAREQAAADRLSGVPFDFPTADEIGAAVGAGLAGHGPVVFNVEQNFSGSEPLAVASESVRGLVAASQGGRFQPRRAVVLL